MENKKICLVSSGGGHLTHILKIKDVWEKYDRIFVTFNRDTIRSELADEKVYFCFYPTNKSIKALIINTFVAIKVLCKEKPDLVISSGAAVAIPFFYISKLMGIKTVYIEIFDRFSSPTITGKICYKVSDVFIVQWEEMKKIYPKAICLGTIF